VTELLPEIHHPLFYRERVKALTLTLHLIVLFLILQYSCLHKTWLNDCTFSLTLTRTVSLIRLGLLLIIKKCVVVSGLCVRSYSCQPVITLKVEACKDTPELPCVCEREREREREGRKAPRLCEKKGIMLHWKLIYACHVHCVLYAMELWGDSLQNTLSSHQCVWLEAESEATW